MPSHCETGIVNERPLVVFRAEAGAESPFWSFAGVGLDYGFFALSADLVARLREWCERIWSVWDGSAPGGPWLTEPPRDR